MTSGEGGMPWWRRVAMGPRERDAQRVLDEMPASERAKLTREQGEALSDAVWDARAQDRVERERA